MGLIGRPRKIAINWNYSGDKARSVLCQSRLGENKMRAAFDDEERSEYVAHILHSSITEGYKKITEVKEVIEKNRKIATKYHKSYAFKYSLEEEQKKRELPVRAILQDVPTRWGSTRSSTGSFLDKEEKGMEAEVNRASEVFRDQHKNMEAINATLRKIKYREEQKLTQYWSPKKT